MADPHSISERHLCSRCARYLESPSPNDDFTLHPDRVSLLRSARNGCRLCGVIEDALTYKSGKYTGIGILEYDDDSESPEVVIKTFFGTAIDRSCTIGVYCGEEYAFLDVVNLSGKSNYTHTHTKC